MLSCSYRQTVICVKFTLSLELQNYAFYIILYLQVIADNKETIREIDLDDKELQKPNCELVIGDQIEDEVAERDLEGTPEVKRFYTEVRLFYCQVLR